MLLTLLTGISIIKLQKLNKKEYWFIHKQFFSFSFSFSFLTDSMEKPACRLCGFFHKWKKPDNYTVISYYETQMQNT